jgi:LDH2 family malate/lactate/ureidoglycolate dehydrogenase
MFEILCGVITGGAYLDQLKGMYKYPDDPSLTCHLMIAINVSAVVSQEELKDRMTVFCQTVKNSPLWDPSREMLLPGEIEYRTSLERTEKGIPLPKALCQELSELGCEMGLLNPLVPMDPSLRKS